MYQICETCDGTGLIDDGDGRDMDCPDCDGNGRIEQYDDYEGEDEPEEDEED